MILHQLQGGCQTIAALTAMTGIDAPTLQWQLAILEYGSCVEKVWRDGNVLFRITQEGEVVAFLDV